jgi:hypothetical protein
MAKAQVQPVVMPAGVSALPVFAWGGGAGRSTVAGLMASALAPHVPTVVADTVPRVASPWSTWTDQPGAGLLSVPGGDPPPGVAVRHAASVCQWPKGSSWHVMTDVRPWNAPAISVPTDPYPWYQLVGSGGWNAVVVDTGHSVGKDLMTSQLTAAAPLTTRWAIAPQCVPIWCLPATGESVSTMLERGSFLAGAGINPQRMVLAVVSLGAGSDPRGVKAALTMLDGQFAAVVRVPFDSAIQAHGLREPGRLDQRTWRAGRELVDAAAHVLAQSAQPAAPAGLPPLTHYGR